EGGENGLETFGKTPMTAAPILCINSAMSFLDLENKKIVVFGVANRKSIAYHIAETLEREGADAIFVVRSEARREQLAKLLPGAEIFVCDVEHDEQIARVAAEIT